MSVLERKRAKYWLEFLAKCIKKLSFGLLLGPRSVQNLALFHHFYGCILQLFLNQINRIVLTSTNYKIIIIIIILPTNDWKKNKNENSPILAITYVKQQSIKNHKLKNWEKNGDYIGFELSDDFQADSVDCTVVHQRPQHIFGSYHRRRRRRWRFHYPNPK